MNDKYVISGIFLFGFTLIIVGALLRLGKLRWMYIGQSLPVFAQRETVHLGIPLGIGVLITGLMTLLPDFNELLNYLVFFSFLITMILAFWQPWWIKPAWLRWMEDNYDYAIEEMFAEARKIGRFEWGKQVKTQAELEAWADEVARRNGWQRLP